MNPVSLYITTSRLVFQSGCGGGPSEAANPTGTDSLGDACSTNSNSSAFADLNRLLPYLRKSLSCAVCCRLLLEPHTPAELNCQHHVCRGCVGERKKLKPSCGSCKDYNRYVENTQLRMLLQCYKSICEYIKTKPFFAEIRLQATGNSSAMNGMSLGGAAVGQNLAGGAMNAHAMQQHNSNNSVPSNLWELIEEGARFQDNYRCSSGLTKSAYSILPCIYPTPTPVAVSVPSVSPIATVGQQQSQQFLMTSNSGNVQMQTKVHPVVTVLEKSPYVVSIDKPQPNQIRHHPQQQQQQLQHQQQQQQQQQQQKEIKFRSAPIKTVSNGSTMYSVLYAGNGNKITIKRKTDPPHVQRRATIHTLDKDGQIKLAKTIAENSASISGFKMPQPTTTAIITPTANTPAAQMSALSKQNAKQLLKRRGCRCGNATATPGKLTCCGQRCPCYVDSKSCIDCKCRGCRNPHRADGMKVRPHIPELQNLEINLHNATDSLTTATTTVLASHVSSVGGSGAGGCGPGGGVTTTLGSLHQPPAVASISSQPSSSGLTINNTSTLVSTSGGGGGGAIGGKGFGQLSLLGTSGSHGTSIGGGSTLKITPTSLANVLSSTNQIVTTTDGMELGPSAGLLDASGFSYLTPASLETATGGVNATVGGTTTQYTVPGNSLTNGGTIHVVGVYTTHLGDVSCSPTLSNMIRTDSALNSLLTQKPPDALLTQTHSLNTLSLTAPTTLLGHSLFNPTTTLAAGGGLCTSNSGGGGGGSIAITSATAGLELTGIGVGDGTTSIDISDQLDLGGTNLITIDGALDDRLHADDV
ncbi:uncharacterized protein LOC129762575 [Toxorhynchites rutilus septentrionalis]|uniref:uncharacterized protein LOC129762575 n=1 Tax=Toxorhynchites rutilus septentrionalis TaxID=329112 RepID=UPI002479210F|nr:uncharacterized protein LOC129762575 [Toxorhynchites rutilus septentrionalis]